MKGSKKILLTGGGGFIGRNLYELLPNIFNITAPSHSELNLNNAELASQYLKNQEFDIIIHAASAGSLRTEREGVYEANTAMFKNLTENSNHFGRMIFFGSGAEYGKQRPIVRAKESDFGKVRPLDEYGQAKYDASEYILKHKNILSLRCFGVFGKYEDYATRFISNVICQSLAGFPIVVNQNSVFDYIYVNDLAKIVAFFIENEPKEKFYNAGGGQGVELLTLAKIVKEITQNPYDIQIINPGLGKEYTCDNSKLLNELGVFKFTPIEQAVLEMVKWYKENWQNVDQSKLTENL
jgi:UDP-glucose 4-epimerase